MSVDHKVFVCCDKSKALEVYGAVKKAFDKFWYDYVKALIEANQSINRWCLPNEIKEKLSCVKIRTSEFDHFWLEFSLVEESRQVFMSHMCSSDYSDTYEGDKIIFSLGHWGDHQKHMDIIKKAIKPFGDVYEDENDCDDIYFEKVN